MKPDPFNANAQGRSVAGTRNILRALHAMFEDAITDEALDFNPVTGVKVRAGDPRATKPSRAPKVWTFAQMHELARVAGTVGKTANPVYGEGLCACGCGERPKGAKSRFVRGHNMEQSATYLYEPMCRVLSDCMVRLGEMLALHRADLCRGCGPATGQLANTPHLHVSRNAHDGKITDGDTETKRHVKIVPLAPSTDAILRRIPPRLDSPLMFPAPRGGVWTEADFYRKVWRPARALVPGMEQARPHDFRHSGISIMRANLGETHASDIAAIAGHSLATMTAIYSHPMGQAFQKVRDIVG